MLDGSFHERDSSTLAFELAAMAAFREGFAKASPQVLEPVMAVEVITPVDYLGDAIGDLNRRRGLVRAQGLRGNAAKVEAEVPLKEMFGYIGSLRALSSGRAQYSMQLDHTGWCKRPKPQSWWVELRAPGQLPSTAVEGGVDESLPPFFWLCEMFAAGRLRSSRLSRGMQPEDHIRLTDFMLTSRRHPILAPTLNGSWLERASCLLQSRWAWPCCAWPSLG